MSPPVLLLTFNRPDLTKAVMERIREAEPPALFVAADGPRPSHEDDERLCAESREVATDVNWDCEVRTLFRDENLGCKEAVGSAITWFFENVEAGIILEDDCLPHPSFFPYCAELLDRYSDDDRIFTISGNNYQKGEQRTDNSYYFSRYMHCWGWATWKRAWKHYFPRLEHWQRVKRQSWLHQIFDSSRSARYWKKIFSRVDAGKVDSWAYVWQYHVWLQSGLNIIPERNLVENIGFGERATHTSSEEKGRAAERIEMPLQHPPFMIRHREADRYTQENHFESTLLERLIRKVRRIATS